MRFFPLFIVLVSFSCKPRIDDSASKSIEDVTMGVLTTVTGDECNEIEPGGTCIAMLTPGGETKLGVSGQALNQLLMHLNMKTQKDMQDPLWLLTAEVFDFTGRADIADTLNSIDRERFDSAPIFNVYMPAAKSGTLVKLVRGWNELGKNLKPAEQSDRFTRIIVSEIEYINKRRERDGKQAISLDKPLVTISGSGGNGFRGYLVTTVNANGQTKVYRGVSKKALISLIEKTQATGSLAEKQELAGHIKAGMNGMDVAEALTFLNSYPRIQIGINGESEGFNQTLEQKAVYYFARKLNLLMRSDDEELTDSDLSTFTMRSR
jgi:hypothetical protein